MILRQQSVDSGEDPQPPSFRFVPTAQPILEGAYSTLDLRRRVRQPSMRWSAADDLVARVVHVVMGQKYGRPFSLSTSTWTCRPSARSRPAGVHRQALHRVARCRRRPGASGSTNASGRRRCRRMSGSEAQPVSDHGAPPEQRLDIGKVARTGWWVSLSGDIRDPAARACS
jgi:hypothetical protein